MPISSKSSKPAWVTKPNQLRKALEHSMYLTDEILESVSVSDSSAFSSGVRQFLYWRRQLRPSVSSNTIMFALLGPAGLVQLNILNVMEEVLKVNNLSNAIECQQGANTKFLAISFKNSDDLTGFQDNFLFCGDAVVAYVTPLASTVHNYSLLWLPPLFPLAKVRGLLYKFSADFSSQHGSTKIAEGRYLPSAVVRGSMQLRAGLSLEDIPHLFPLPKPHFGNALLIIDGRDPFCLKCLSSGHLRKSCSSTRCEDCHLYHSSTSICDRKSYAGRVSALSGLDSTYCWPDDIGDLEEGPLLPLAGSIVPPGETHNSTSTHNCPSVVVSPKPPALSVSAVPALVTVSDSLAVETGGDVTSAPECSYTLNTSPVSIGAYDSSLLSPHISLASLEVDVLSSSEPSLSDIALPSSYLSDDSSLGDTPGLFVDVGGMSVDPSIKSASKRKSTDDIVIDSSGSDNAPGVGISRHLKKKDRGDPVGSDPPLLPDPPDRGKMDYTRCSSSSLVGKSSLKD